MLRRRQRAEHRPPHPRPGRGHGTPADDDQERLILSALDDLRDTSVREVMTPRVDVVGLSIPVHGADVSAAVRTSGHSCFPVYDDDLDHLVGVLFVNDLFRAGWEIEGRRSGPGGSAGGNGGGNGGASGPGNGGRADGGTKPSPLEISRRLRQPYLVPESRHVLDVLSDMRRDRRAFAVVVDEYGGVAGVLTIKDLLSALVGDLRDEFDGDGEPDIIRVDRTRWLVDGSASIDDIREQLGIALPEGEYVTLGGYLFDVFGHIPDEGEKAHFEDWELRVAEMDKRRVAKVVVQGPEPAAAEASTGR
ncbi:MAG: hemolysin family protein [Acidimicrobiales bacterium]